VPSNRGAEYQLLLDALTPGAPAYAAREAPDAIRWDHLLGLAYWHRLRPMLFQYVRGDGRAPADVSSALEDAYVTNGTRNLFVGAALERILKALAAADVPAMLLKGVALIETVYPDPALREMSDMDILVPKTKLDDANAAVAEIGYGRKRAITRAQDTQEWMRAHHRHDPPLVDEHQYVALELHHHIVKGEPSTHFDVDGLWQRARTGTSGPPHLLPASEDLLLHACIHFSYHRKTSSVAALAQLGDIAWIMNREQIDWRALADNAQGYRLEDAVFLALFAARELELAVPPRHVLEALRPLGFNDRLGRRMLALRVLRTHNEVPRRSLKKAIAPDRWSLERSWGAAPRGRLSLLTAYLRRAAKSLRYVRHVLRQPRTLFHDYRLNRQLDALKRRRSDDA
jgi:hypothetical protein